MPLLRGRAIDAQSRCTHWHGPTDIVAFRLACCDGWWPCIDCHAETAGHDAKPWPADRHGEPAVLCGACGHTMTPVAYVACASHCPACHAAFNPKCKPHWPQYFEA